MNDSDKSELLEKAIKNNNCFREVYPTIKGNQTQIENLYSQVENNPDMMQFFEKSSEFIRSFGEDVYQFRFRNSDNPDGIRNP